MFPFRATHPEHRTSLVTQAREIIDETNELRRANVSLRLRTRALERALTEAVPSTRIAVSRESVILAPTLRVARTLEMTGRVPIVRWHRGADGVIDGIELSVLQTAEERAASAEAPAGEMGCIS